LLGQKKKLLLYLLNINLCVGSRNNVYSRITSSCSRERVGDKYFVNKVVNYVFFFILRKQSTRVPS